MKRILSLGLLLGLASACGTYDYPVNPGSGGSGARTGDSTRFLGRVNPSASGGTLLAWSGTGIVTAFTGKSLNVNMILQDPADFVEVEVVLDGNAQAQPILLKSGTTQYTVTADSDGTHDLQLIKRTEATEGGLLFQGFDLSATLVATPAPSGRFIEFIGDSITAGYGVLASSYTCKGADGTTNDPNMESSVESYAYLAAQTLGADSTQVAVSGRGVAINYDGSPQNGPATELTMPSLWKLVDPNDASSTYDFKRQADVVVINLGTNDFSHYNQQVSPSTLPPQSDFVSAYVKLVKDVRAQYANAQIILALGPMIYDSSSLKMFTTANTYVQAVVSQVGDSKVSTVVYPANSTDVGCDYHPNLKSATSMAQGLVTQIQKVTGWQ